MVNRRSFILVLRGLSKFNMTRLLMRPVLAVSTDIAYVDRASPENQHPLLHPMKDDVIAGPGRCWSNQDCSIVSTFIEEYYPNSLVALDDEEETRFRITFCAQSTNSTFATFWTNCLTCLTSAAINEELTISLTSTRTQLCAGDSFYTHPFLSAYKSLISFLRPISPKITPRDPQRAPTPTIPSPISYDFSIPSFSTVPAATAATPSPSTPTPYEIPPPTTLLATIPSTYPAVFSTLDTPAATSTSTNASSPIFGSVGPTPTLATSQAPIPIPAITTRFDASHALSRLGLSIDESLLRRMSWTGEVTMLMTQAGGDEGAWYLVVGPAESGAAEVTVVGVWTAVLVVGLWVL